MRKALSANLRLIFLLGDLFILNAAAVIAFSIFSPSQQWFTREHAYVILALNFCWLTLSILYNPYKFSRVARFAKILRTHFSFIFFHFLFVVSLLFLFNLHNIPTTILLANFALSVGLLFVWRVFYFYLNKIIINKKLNFKNVVIVGFGDLAWEMRKFFRLHPEFGFRFLSYFDQKIQNREVRPLAELDLFCKENNVQEIYCCLPYTDNNMVKSLIDYGLSNLIKVKLITDYRGFFSRGVYLEKYDDIPVLNVAAVPLDERNNQIIKHIFDLIFSSLVIILILSWMIPIIAILIKLDSKGPVFFKQ